MRLQLKFEPRGIWVGCYVATDAIYICLLPFVVLRWQRYRQFQNKFCNECSGYGHFWTEWSDKAELAAEETGINIVYKPNPPDGTVLILCPVCRGLGQ